MTFSLRLRQQRISLLFTEGIGVRDEQVPNMNDEIYVPQRHRLMMATIIIMNTADFFWEKERGIALVLFM